MTERPERIEGLEHDYNARVAASLDTEQRLQRIVEVGERLKDDFLMLRDACGHCSASDKPPNARMIENADTSIAAYREAVGYDKHLDRRNAGGEHGV